MRAQGEYSAKSGYGGIKIDVKNSPVQAETNSGSIEIRGCRGAVKALSGYGTVDVHGDDALVQLRSNSGSVQFVGSLAAGDSKVTSGYGELTVKLPAYASFKVQAKTGYGCRAHAIRHEKNQGERQGASRQRKRRPEGSAAYRIQ